MPNQDSGSHFMLPFAAGATIILGGSSLAELISHGAVRSPDNAAELYTAIMAAYAGAGEVKGWLRKNAPFQADLENPWLERARRGGVFVGFWLILYAVAYVLRLVSPVYPMPHELKSIALQMVGLFFVTYSARNFRRVRYGAKGTEDQDSGAVDDMILRWLRTQPDGATAREIQAQFPDLPRRTLNRAFLRLSTTKAVTREGSAFSPDGRYRASTH